MKDFLEKEYVGIYGNYKITLTDVIEVQRYRISVLVCGLSFTIGLIQWLILGPKWASIWLFPLIIGVGLALKWVHIYLKPLHLALQFLWILGLLGTSILAINLGPDEILLAIANRPILILVIGPLFAAITGLGFKEFFCFGRPEAIGLTLLLPIGLGSHLLGLLSPNIVMVLLSIASILLLILSLRKFGIDASADIGDKSVFNYLKEQQRA